MRRTSSCLTVAFQTVVGEKETSSKDFINENHLLARLIRVSLARHRRMTSGFLTSFYQWQKYWLILHLRHDAFHSVPM